MFFFVFFVSQQGAGRPGGSGLTGHFLVPILKLPGNRVNLNNSQTLRQHNSKNKWTLEPVSNVMQHIHLSMAVTLSKFELSS